MNPFIPNKHDKALYADMYFVQIQTIVATKG